MVTTFPGKQGGTSDMMDSYIGMCSLAKQFSMGY